MPLRSHQKWRTIRFHEDAGQRPTNVPTQLTNDQQERYHTALQRNRSHHLHTLPSIGNHLWTEGTVGKGKTSREKNYRQLPQIPTINHHQDIRLCARTDGLPDQRQKHHLQFPTHQVDHPVADLLYRDVLPHVRPLHQHGQQVLPRMTDL